MPLLHTFVLAVAGQFIAFDNDPFVASSPENFVWINGEGACPILVDSDEDKGVLRAVINLLTDPLGKIKRKDGKIQFSHVFCYLCG